jgi:hypothetical protein
MVCVPPPQGDELKEAQGESREATKEAREVARDNQAVLKQVAQAEAAIAEAERDVQQVGVAGMHKCGHWTDRCMRQSCAKCPDTSCCRKFSGWTFKRKSLPTAASSLG